MARVLYIQTSGTDTPERLYAPFVLAMTARAMDMDAEIFFMIKGVTVVKRGEAEKIRIGNFPSLAEIMQQAIAAGVKIYICEQSTQLLGMERGDFIPEGTIVGATTLNDIAIDADAVITF
ncbi:sulfur reduction protein DsrE [Methanoculleus sp. FWC-SCC1]|uniref:Sulfur reduction protein DsrE n=1 Tax=Methanoculleus frigidifontis TaxID=2584085 RepID=A0ABT8MDV0_9EURY|nr:DsrE family protein [Methanoculleus sp. FWC-SCC1]MDN7026118.1 sulfur reduction protein DsrE [Methanoculleus sp. FWC-SCC1]